MLDETTLHSILIIVVMSVITLILRVLPFLIFGSKRKTPDYIIWLGKVLPPAIIGMLVVYCFKNVTLAVYPFALPELIASALVVVLYLWKKNSLLSIGAGTIGYMILVQFVFN